jgi:hypothetical protein
VEFTENEWKKSICAGAEGGGTGSAGLFAALPAVVLGGTLFTTDQVVTPV